MKPISRSSVGLRARGALISLGLLVLISVESLPTVAADEAQVEAERSGTGVAVHAQAVIEAPLAVIWNTLTDYERLPEFIPGLKKSHVLRRRGRAAIVEQSGAAGLLFLRYPIDVVVESEERPPHEIAIHALRGNLKELDGRYWIEASGSPHRYILHWTGIIEPDTALPAFVTVPLMRASIKAQFLGMVREIERRKGHSEENLHAG